MKCTKFTKSSTRTPQIASAITNSAASVINCSLLPLKPNEVLTTAENEDVISNHTAQKLMSLAPVVAAVTTRSSANKAKSQEPNAMKPVDRKKSWNSNEARKKDPKPRKVQIRKKKR